MLVGFAFLKVSRRREPSPHLRAVRHRGVETEPGRGPAVGTRSPTDGLKYSNRLPLSIRKPARAPA